MAARNPKTGFVTICASGPSMTRADAELSHARSTTIVINDTWKLLPCADYLYAADSAWWIKRAPSVEAFAGARLSQTRSWPPNANVRPEPFKYKLLHGYTPPDFEKQIIYSGRNSAFQAMQIALLMGAKRVVFLGLDLSIPPGSPSHWHGDYDDPSFNRASPYGMFIECFDKFSRLYTGPCKIVNASRATALTGFPRVKIEEAYDDLL